MNNFSDNHLHADVLRYTKQQAESAEASRRDWEREKPRTGGYLPEDIASNVLHYRASATAYLEAFARVNGAPMESRDRLREALSGMADFYGQVSKSADATKDQADAYNARSHAFRKIARFI